VLTPGPTDYPVEDVIKPSTTNPSRNAPAFSFGNAIREDGLVKKHEPMFPGVGSYSIDESKIKNKSPAYSLYKQTGLLQKLTKN